MLELLLESESISAEIMGKFDNALSITGMIHSKDVNLESLSAFCSVVVLGSSSSPWTRLSSKPHPYHGAQGPVRDRVLPPGDVWLSLSGWSSTKETPFVQFLLPLGHTLQSTQDKWKPVLYRGSQWVEKNTALSLDTRMLSAIRIGRLALG